MAEFIIELEGRAGDIIEFEESADTAEQAEAQARARLADLSGQFEARTGTSPRGEPGSLLQRATSTPQLIFDESKEGARTFARTLGVNLLDIFGSDNAALDARIAEMKRIGTVEQQQAAFRIRNDIPKQVAFVSEFTGQLFPEVILGGGAGQIRAFIPRVLAEGAVGGMGGLGSDLDLDNAVSNAWLGGGIGSGLSSGIWFFSGGEQALQQQLRSNRALGIFNPAAGPRPGGPGITGGLARENELLFRTFDPSGKIAPTASEITQGRFAAEWESLVSIDPGTAKSKFFVNRESEIIKAFDEVEEALNVRGLSTPQVIDTTLDAVDNNLTKLRINRKNAWNSTMSEAVRLTGGEVKVVGGRTVFRGGQKVIDGQVTTEAFQNVVDDIVDQRNLGLIDEADSERVFNFVRKWNTRLGREGTLSVADSQQLLIDLTNELDGTGKIFGKLGPKEGRSFATQLKDAALADIDSTIGRGDIAGDAADLIREARNTYKSLSRGIDGFQQLGLSRLAQGTSSEFINTFRNMDPRVLKETLTELDSINPETANALRGRILADSLDRARIPDPTGNTASKVNFKKVVDDIVEGDFGLDRFEALFPAGKDIATDRARTGLEVLQRITSDVALLGASDIGTRTGAAAVREVALTGAEGGLGFKVRAGISAMFPGQVERALFGPQGVRALIRIGEAAEGIRLRAPAGITVAGGRTRAALNSAIADYERILEGLFNEQQLAESVEARKELEATVIPPF